ncbi:MAG: TonB-dependent receptor, partial [Acidobacteria bacterium]|nr:TonB-dependent receptor [Acidobacteriota bacterium]
MRFPAILLVLVLASSAPAQVATGSVTGIVTDPSQGRLPNVSLRLANEDTGVTRTATTNSEGEYTFPLLGSGRYRIEAEASGFQRFTRSSIVVELGRVVRLDIALPLGQLTESVDVSAAAPLLESESSTVGQFIENKTIADMPLNGRRVGELLGLMGGAVFVRGDVIRPRVAVAGGRADHQQWMLDGVNASNIALEIPQALFNPPVEAVQEIRIQQNAYSAEFGNSAGGVVTMTTRSGSNKFNGLVYEYLRNDTLDARNFFAASRPPLRWNVFGGSLGGPVIRNRTFFFTHVEFQRQRVGVVRLLTVPGEAQRRGDFSQTTNAAGALIRIYDPATSRPDPQDPSRTIRTAFPGNLVPSSRIDPVAAKVIATYPLPNQPPTNRAGANNFNRNASNALNITTWTSKIDHIFSERDRLSVRYVMHDFPTNNTAAFDEPAADPNANESDRRAHSLVFDEIHSFTPTLINEFRLNWQPRRFRTNTLSLDQGWPTKLGLRGVSDRAFPRINAAGFVSLGATNQERVQIPIHDTHVLDSVSLYRAGHSVRLGGEIRLARNVDDLNSLTSGQFSFNVQPTGLPGVSNTGNSIASLLLGFPNSANTRDSDELDRRAKYFALYAQDDWKVTPGFTLNFGVRWEAHTPRFDANNRQNGFDPSQINPVSGTPGVITFAGLDGLGSRIYDGDWNNVAPRVGFAWRAFGQSDTIVRAGYGVFFGPPLPGSNNTSAGFEISGDFSTPDNGITAPFYLRDGMPDVRTRPQLGPGFGAVRPGSPVRFAPQFIEKEREIGYSQQWNVTVQRELGWSTLLEFGYLASVGHKLPGPNSNINQVRPELMGPGNAQVRRPFPQFGNVTTVAPMWGNSSYHGLNIKIEKRFSHGLNFLGNYTWSKFIDDVPAGFEIGAVSGGMQNYYDRRAEKALSGNDVRNRFVWSSVYEIPVGRGRRWLAEGPAALLAGGWNIGAIVTLQDGSPVGLTVQTNTTNAFTPGAL